jgi:hypothetical protein
MMAGLLFTVLLRPSVSSRIKGSIMVLLCFGVLVSVMFIFYGGDIIQTLILNRLEIKDGQLAGYNRTTIDVDIMYESFISSDSRWLGLGENSLILGSGYKVFILQNGLIEDGNSWVNYITRCFNGIAICQTTKLFACNLGYPLVDVLHMNDFCLEVKFTHQNFNR